MTVDNTVITYTITGKTAQGNSIGTLTKTQTLSKSKSGTGGRVVTLSTTKQVFVYDSSGNNPTGTATITATAHNLDSTGYYRFLKNGTEVQASSTTNTYNNYTPASSITSMPEIIEVELRDGSASGSVVATDEMSLIGIQPGSDVITAILSNEAHTLPVTNTGTVTYTGSGTTIKVFQGATALAYKPNWNGTQAGKWIFTSTASNITRGSVTDSGNYATVGDHNSMTATNASITYSITGRTFEGESFTIEKIQSFAKSVDGDDGQNGPAGLRTANGFVYYRSTDSTTSVADPDDNTTPSYDWSNGTITGMATGWTHEPPVMEDGKKMWYSFYTVSQSSPSDATNTPSFGTPAPGTQFTGLVSFTQDPNLGDIFKSGGSNITEIYGGHIKTDTILANRLRSSNWDETSGTGFSAYVQKFNLGTGSSFSVELGSSSFDLNTAVLGWGISSYDQTNLVVGTGGLSTNAPGVFGGALGTAGSSYGGVFGHTDEADPVTVPPTLGEWHNVAALGGHSHAGFFQGAAWSNGTKTTYNSTTIGSSSVGVEVVVPNGSTTKIGLSNYGILIQGTNSDILTSGNVTAYGAASDIRLKDNIEVIPDALDKVSELRGVTFDYKRDKSRSTGLIAQELQKVLPEAVYETNLPEENEEDKVLAIRYGNVVGLLVEAIKELKAEIEELKRGDSN